MAKQYILDEDEDLALRWALDTINHIDCAIYVTGGHLPMEDSVAPRNLEEIVKKIGEKQLMVLMDNKQINIRKGIIAKEDVGRMSPAATGTYIYNNKPYLLIKSYTFSWITSGNGYISLH